MATRQQLIEEVKKFMKDVYYGHHDAPTKFNDEEENIIKFYKDNPKLNTRLNKNDKGWLQYTLSYFIDGVDGQRYVRTTSANYHIEMNLQVIPDTLEIITEVLDNDGEYVDEYDTTEEYKQLVKEKQNV